MEDAMEMADDEDLDDEADEEVDKVLFEITAGKLRSEQEWFHIFSFKVTELEKRSTSS